MADLPQYWTPEFVDVFVAALHADPAFQKAARKFHDTVVLRCLDAPGGKDVSARYTIDGGHVTAQIRREDAPSRALRAVPFRDERAMARTTAPYALWTKLDRGETNVVAAIASPDYHVEGSKVAILKNLRMFNAMSAAASRVEKRY